MFDIRPRLKSDSFAVPESSPLEETLDLRGSNVPDLSSALIVPDASSDVQSKNPQHHQIADMAWHEYTEDSSADRAFHTFWNAGAPKHHTKHRLQHIEGFKFVPMSELARGNALRVSFLQSLQERDTAATLASVPFEQPIVARTANLAEIPARRTIPIPRRLLRGSLVDRLSWQSPTTTKNGWGMWGLGGIAFGLLGGGGSL